MRNKNKTTTAKEESQPALVPKLRFPEFLREKEWKEHSLGSVCSFFSGGTPSTSKPDYYGGNIPFIRSAEIARDRTELNLTPEGLANSAAKIVTKGDVLIALYGANSGEVALSKIDGAINQAVLCLKCKWSNAFVFYYLNFMKDFIVATYLQGGQGNLSGEIIKSIVVGFPSLPEQQKIAACLSSVDKLIAAQARKVEALKVHKKGLMQQLFPREGETQPWLRFPEFRGKGEWEEKTLGRIGSFTSGGTPSKDNPDYWNGSIPWVSASSMYDLIIDKADHYVTPQAIGNGTRIAKKGSILILVRGSMLFKRVPICIAGIDVAFNQDVKSLEVDASIHSGFLLYQLSAFHSRFLINETGIGAGKIELDHLKGFSLFIPGPGEQHCIASCLSSLDALITAETQKVEALKAHKKGLMQGLFPGREESIV